jgi:enoyl-CoA hydratase
VEYRTISYEVSSSKVATVRLDSPETRNALSDELLDELTDALERLRESDQARCVVLTSTHEKVFSSGASLDQFSADATLVQKHFGSRRFLELFRLLGELEKPSICAANGHVLAGALGVCLACDLVIAKDTATFGTPEINVGAFPFMIMALIYRNIGRKQASEMLLLGERLSAHEALAAGLVNRVASAEQFEGLVDDWAQKLASKSPVVMRLGKDAMFRQQDMALQDALEFLHSQLSLALSTDDLAEGVRAFFEKREPQWSGR